MGNPDIEFVLIYWDEHGETELGIYSTKEAAEEQREEYLDGSKFVDIRIDERPRNQN